MAEQRGEAADVVLLLREHERDALARAAGAARAADAVHVALAVLRRVEVDDVADVVEVEPAGGDVGGDERPRLPERKRSSDFSRADWDMSPCSATAATPRRVQLLGEPVGAALGAHEDERELAVGLEQLDEAVELVVGVT